MAPVYLELFSGHVSSEFHIHVVLVGEQRVVRFGVDDRYSQSFDFDCLSYREEPIELVDVVLLRKVSSLKCGIDRVHRGGGSLGLDNPFDLGLVVARCLTGGQATVVMLAVTGFVGNYLRVGFGDGNDALHTGLAMEELGDHAGGNIQHAAALTLEVHRHFLEDTQQALSSLLAFRGDRGLFDHGGLVGLVGDLKGESFLHWNINTTTDKRQVELRKLGQIIKYEFG